jgi:hypothetical protein
MIFGFLTLFISLTIAGVAAWFSIEGLMAIFSASALQIAIMAGTLEVGKLLTASWLYRYWHTAGLLIKTYLTIAVLVLMLITSMGIFGYLSKAHLDQAGVSGDAIATVDRLDGQISREENKITILQDRIASINGTGSFNLADSIRQQESIRDGAWAQVQGDIDYNQQQISSVRAQLTTDLQGLDSREENLDKRLSELDRAVNELRNKGVETIETDSGGVFRSAEVETIDYVAQASSLREIQQTERDEIANQKSDLNNQRQQLRAQSTADMKTFQDAIDRYREQAQGTMNSANAEINRLRNQSVQSQDDTLVQIDEYNTQIDSIYDTIASLKEEKFEAQSIVRGLEKEVGPIKYVAELIYGDGSQDYLDKSVRLFILMLVFVFDPLAVILLIAANQTLMKYGINLEKDGPDDAEDNTNNTSSNIAGEPDKQSLSDTADSKRNNKNSASTGTTTNDDIHLQQPGNVNRRSRANSSNKSTGVVIKEVEKELDFDFSIPPSIVALEKKLQEKLNGK